MIIVVYKGFDEKSGNWRDPLSEFVAICGDSGQLRLRDTKLCTGFSNV